MRLGMDPMVRELEVLVSSNIPYTIFLMEVKVDRKAVEKVQCRIHFEGLFYMMHVNNGGGLAVLWRKQELAHLNKFVRNFIDVTVCEEGGHWRLTGFYGFPKGSRRSRQELWDCITQLTTLIELPWCMIGDFNDMTSIGEKVGGRPRAMSLLNGFRKTLTTCGLTDLGMRGYLYTWEHSIGTNMWITKRLDRAVATTGWSEHFNAAWVQNICTSESDHMALILH